jgi:hypothetical protein
MILEALPDDALRALIERAQNLLAARECSRRAGRRRVFLQVSEEKYAFARAMADRHGYFGPDDYLNALLNTAVLTEMDDEDWPIKRRAPSAADPDDLDDGIPF